MFNRRSLFKLFAGLGVAGSAGYVSGSTRSGGKSMAIAGPSNEVHEMLRCLGIDPKNTREVHMHIVPDDVVMLDVTKIVQHEELRKLKQFFDQRYGLVRLDNRK